MSAVPQVVSVAKAAANMPSPANNRLLRALAHLMLWRKLGAGLLKQGSTPARENVLRAVASSAIVLGGSSGRSYPIKVLCVLALQWLSEPLPPIAVLTIAIRHLEQFIAGAFGYRHNSKRAFPGSKRAELLLVLLHGACTSLLMHTYHEKHHVLPKWHSWCFKGLAGPPAPVAMSLCEHTPPCTSQSSATHVPGPWCVKWSDMTAKWKQSFVFALRVALPYYFGVRVVFSGRLPRGRAWLQPFIVGLAVGSTALVPWLGGRMRVGPPPPSAAGGAAAQAYERRCRKMATARLALSWTGQLASFGLPYPDRGLMRVVCSAPILEAWLTTRPFDLEQESEGAALTAKPAAQARRDDKSDGGDVCVCTQSCERRTPLCGCSPGPAAAPGAALAKPEKAALRATAKADMIAKAKAERNSAWPFVKALRRVNALRWFVCMYPAIMCQHPSLTRLMPFLS